MKRTRLLGQVLETRRLLTVTASLSGGTLQVDITGNDTAKITQDAGDNIEVQDSTGTDVVAGPVPAYNVNDIIVAPSGAIDKVDLTALDTAKSYTGLNTLTVQADPTNGATTSLGTITTSGSQEYDTPVDIPTAVTLSTTNSPVTFGSTVHSVGGAGSLRVLPGAGNVTFDDQVGDNSNDELASLGVGGTGTTTIGAGVYTSGAQIYDQPVMLGAREVMLNSIGGGDITLASTVDGAADLTLETAGISTFDYVVGGTTPLASIATDGAGTVRLNGGPVTTTGNQIFSDAVILGTTTTLTSSGSGNVTFASTLDGPYGLLVYTKGMTTFGGAVGGTTPLDSVSLNFPGTADLDGGAVTTSNGQSYLGAVTLGAATTLTSTGGAVELGDTFDGAFDLTVDAAIETRFFGAVGGTTPLKSITTAATGRTTLVRSVNTTGDQTYNDAVTLEAGPSLTTKNGNVTFGSTVDALAAFSNDLSVSAGSGNVLFAGNVGSTAPLGDVTVTNAGNVTLQGIFDAGSLMQAAGTRTTELDGNVTVSSATGLSITTAALKINGPAITATAVAAPAVFSAPVTLASDVVITSAGGPISFGGSLDGSHNLTLTAGSGNVTFVGAVGGTTPLSDVTINSAHNVTADGTFDAGSLRQAAGTGTTQLDGDVTVSDATGISLATGAVTLKGPTVAVSSVTPAPVNLSAPVTLGGNLTIDASAAGGNVTFGGTVDGAFALIVKTTGTTTFDGAIGNRTALTSITADSAPGIANLNGGSVNTTGNQTYYDAVILGAATTLTSTGGGNITFLHALDGAFGLTANTSGTTTFDAAVGGSTPIATVATRGGGSTDISGGSVKTTGDQNYDGAVSLGYDTTLTGATIGFDATVGGGNFGLSIEGNAVFGSAPADTVTNLTTLTVSGSTTVNTTNITSSGNQTYNGAVQLGSDTTLDAASASITFASTVDGAFALTVQTTGSIDFAAPVGGTKPLTTLFTNESGPTAINAAGSAALPSITTSGFQDFRGPVTLGAAVELAAKNSQVTFESTVDSAANSAEGLTLDLGTGDVVFGGAVGAGTALASLTVNGDTHIEGSNVTSLGAQAYTGQVQLSGDTSVITTNGDVGFGSAVYDTTAGIGSLTIAVGSGNVAIGDPSITSSLTALSISSTGTATINGNITTTSAGAAQTYNEAVVIGANSSFITDNGDIAFESTVGAAAAGTQTLAVAAGSGNITFAGPVGGKAALGDVTVVSADDVTIQSTFQAASLRQSAGTGTTELDGSVAVSGVEGLSLTAAAVNINGSTITATSASAAPIAFATPVTFSSNLTIDASAGGGGVTFGGTLNGGQSLNVVAGSGNVAFDGPVGASGMQILTVDGTGTTTIAANVTTTGTQTYSTPVDITTAVTLSTTNSSVTFGGTVSGASGGGGSLTVLPGSGNVAFDGQAGTGLASLSVNGSGTTTISGNITTIGTQTYKEAVMLSADTTLTGTTVTFAGTVDSDTTARALAVVGAAMFDAAVGGMNPLASLLAGATDIAGGAVTTTGTQGYGPLTLSADTTLTGTTMTFFSTLDSDTKARALTINGGATFSAAVGANAALASLSVEGGGLTSLDIAGNFAPLNITTTGNQTFAGATLLGANTNLRTLSGGTVEFVGDVDSESSTTPLALSIAAGGGNVIFEGSAGTAKRIGTVDVSGAGIVTLGKTADGRFEAASLSLSGLTGTLTVNDAIVPNAGAVLSLQAPAIDLANSQNFGSANVTFITNNLTLSTGVSLAGTGTLAFQAATDSANIDINGSGSGLSLAGNTLASFAGFGKIAFGSATATGTFTIDAATTFTSPVEFDQQPGGPGKLIIDGNLMDTAGGTAPGITIKGSGHTTTLNGNVVTKGTPIVIDDSVVLGSPSTITLDTTNGGTVPAGASITLADPGTVNDDKANSSALVLNAGTTGTITLGGAVGASVPIAGLSATAAAIVISGSSIVTAGNQSYSGNVTLQTGVSLNTTAAAPASAGNVLFSGAVDGGQNLTITAGSGNVTFTGAIGAHTPLADVTVAIANNVMVQGTFSGGSLTETQGTGLTQLNGAVTVSDANGLSITASKIQLAGPTITASAKAAPVNFAAPVTLTGNVAINATGGAGAVTFGGSLDSDSANTPRTLTINGNATFDGEIGATYPLASLTVTGTSLMKEGNAHVANSTYEQPVTLNADTTLYGNVTFDSSIDSLSDNPALSLTINALQGGVGSVVFYAPVGSLHALKSLKVNVPATFTTSADGKSHGGSVNTVLGQTYGGPTVLQSTADFISTQGGAVNFFATLDGPAALTTNTNGTTTFAADVGAQSALASIHVNGATTFGGSVPLASATVERRQSPQVAASVNNLAPVILQVNCNGPQSYDGPVLVQASVAIDTLTSGDIVFGSTVDSTNGSELTVSTLVTNNNVTTATGNVQFGGPVGSTGKLANLAVLSGGPFMLNSAVNTAGNIIVTVRQNAGGSPANLDLATGAALNAAGQIKLLSSNNVNLDVGSTVSDAAGTVIVQCDYLNGAGASTSLAGTLNSPSIQIKGGGNDVLYVNDSAGAAGADNGQSLSGYGLADQASYSGLHPEIITPVDVPSIKAKSPGSEAETIASLLGSSSAFGGTATNSDLPPGIAVTGLNDTDSADGMWEYSKDGGTSWTPFGSPIDTSALLLGASDEIQFVSGSNVVARNGFSFRAWDGKTGTDGGTYDTQGGAAPGVSSITQTVTIQVVAPSGPGGTFVIGSGTISVLADSGILQYEPTGNGVTVTSGTVKGAQGGTFMLNADGSFTYTPGSGFPGFDSTTATVTDAQGNTSSATVTVLSQHAGVVWKFYESVLNRTPDPGGLQYWTQDFNNGGKTGDIAAGFFLSDELLDKIIKGFYDQYLLRPYDPNGLSYFVQLWKDDGGPEQVNAQFADSPEFYQSAGGTPDSWLDALYERILSRSPDPNGKAYWLNFYQQQTAAGVDPGQARYEIALGFFTAPEAYGDDVAGWYEEYLFRAPSESEKSTYENQLVAGATDKDIEEAITNLPEYANNPPTPAAGAAAALPDYYQNQGSAQSQAVGAAKDAIFSGL